MKLYKIKELEWKQSHIRLNTYSSDGYIINEHGANTFWRAFGENDNESGSLESAKLACRQHYEQRLLASLEEVDVLERVKERCNDILSIHVTYHNEPSFVVAVEAKQQLSKELLQLIEQK